MSLPSDPATRPADLTDSCSYCTDRGLSVPPNRPLFTELVSDGLRAEYQCRRCLGSWTTTWDLEHVKSGPLADLIGALASLFETEPDPERAA